MTSWNHRLEKRRKDKYPTLVIMQEAKGGCGQARKRGERGGSRGNYKEVGAHGTLLQEG